MDIFKQFVRNYGNQSSVNDQIIRKYLLDNWEADEKIMDISKNAYVSPASISRYIKKTRLATYKNYLRQKRISRDNFKNNIEYDIVFEDLVKQKQKLISDTLAGIDKEQLMGSCNEVENGIQFFEMLDLNPVYQACFDEWTIYLAQGIEQLLYCYNPNKIIIAGGISEQSDLIIPMLYKHLNQMNEPYIKNLEIKVASQRNNAGLIGAVKKLRRDVC